MSRSRKKIPIAGIAAAPSEKKGKRMANRKLRRKTNALLQRGSEEDKFPLLRELSNVWSMEKDGKQYFDLKKYPKGLRK